MKKSVTIALIAAAVCLAAGFAAIGVFIGLNKDLSFDEMIDKTAVENYEVAEMKFAPNFRNISINDNEAEVELIRSDVGSPRIEYSKVEDRDYIVTVDEDNGVLDIRVDDRRSSFLNFNVTFKNMFLRVYLPADEYESLTIDSSSGNVSVPADFTFGDVVIEASSGGVKFDAEVTGSADVKTSSGSVKMANLNPKTMNVETTSGGIKVTEAGAAKSELRASSGSISVSGGVYGDLKVSNSSGGVKVTQLSADSVTAECSSGSAVLESCTVSGDARAKCSSGSIKFVSCTAGSISADSSSGSITLDGTVAAGLADLSNSSGGVTFKNADAGELIVNTTSGSVKGTLLTGKIFDVRTSSGSENVPASDREGGLCTIETGSGSVKITIAE